MALKNCKECGKEVSTQAKTCPNCGAQLKGGGCAASIARIILFLLAIASIPLALAYVGPMGLLGTLILFLLALFLK
jgi:predicted amidophosphoribosyltransferase